jgi:hypothetical protein
VGTKDGSTTDSSTPTPANIIVAHTAPGVPPFRICIGLNQSGLAMTVNPGIPPLPNGPSAVPYGFPGAGASFPAVAPGTPGIYPGTIGALPQAVDFTNDFLTPFVVLSSSVATYYDTDGGNPTNTADGGKEPDCATLVGKDGQGGLLKLNTDYFQLPAIPAQTLVSGKAFLLTVNGCLSAAATANPEAALGGYTCGAGYDGGNTANIGVVSLDTTTPLDDGGIGIQFAHRSLALQNTPITATLPDGGTVLVHDPASSGVAPLFIQPTLVDVPNDAGPDGGDAGSTLTPESQFTFVGSDGGSVPAAILYDPGTATTGVTPVQSVPVGQFAFNDAGAIDQTNTAFGVFTLPIQTLPPPYWPEGDLIPMSLDQIFQLSGWQGSTATSPAAFQIGATYTFVLIGDPAAA